jgi:hypothetical protein
VDLIPLSPSGGWGAAAKLETTAKPLTSVIIKIAIEKQFDF